MSNKRRRLASWLQGNGIEIGALHRPLELGERASVRYVDMYPTDVLKQQYPQLGDVEFAPVSIIATATNLSMIGDGEVDFIVANHVVEHLEAPIQALIEWHRVLRPGGYLFLAVPDGRVTFDRCRPLTPVEHLIDEHRVGLQHTRAAHYREHITLAEIQPELAPLAGEIRDVEARVQLMVDTGFSAHFHVWRPDTFLEFIAVAQREAQIEFDVAAVAACERGVDDEFLVVLVKGNSMPPEPPGLPWGQALPGASEPLERPQDQALPGSPGQRQPWWVTARRRIATGPLGPVLRRPYRALRRLVQRRSGPGVPAETDC